MNDKALSREALLAELERRGLQVRVPPELQQSLNESVCEAVVDAFEEHLAATGRYPAHFSLDWDLRGNGLFFSVATSDLRGDPK